MMSGISNHGINPALLFIAKHGPKIPYEVYKGTKLGRSTAYKKLKLMEKKGLLFSEISGKTRAGLDIKKYELTLLGFISAFRMADERDWRDIISKWGSLVPLILGKWSHFEENGVESIAIWRLKRACAKRSWVPVIQPPEEYQIHIAQHFHEPIEGDEKARMKLVHSRLIMYFTQDFYQPYFTLFNSEGCRKWAVACKNDPEIRKYLLNELVSHREDFSSILDKVNMTMDILQSK